jgi:hypothetical protein
MGEGDRFGPAAWVRAAAVIGRLAEQRADLTLGRLDEQEVRRRASRQLGRPMVADDPGLRVLLADLAQAPLTPLGRVWLRSELIRRQVSQARLEDEFRRRPGLLNTPLWRPLVIVGLPRTGTTLLHSLLGVTRRRWCCRSGSCAGPTRSHGDGWTGRPGLCGQRPWRGWPGRWHISRGAGRRVPGARGALVPADVVSLRLVWSAPPVAEQAS